MAEPGGWRVESGQPDERRRYLFVAPCERLRGLGETIDEPFVALKLCRPGAELIALLPERWRLTDDNRMMVRDVAAAREPVLPAGYRLVMNRVAPVIEACILDADGAIAARGYGSEGGGVFIYDRIVTEPQHRRRGLGAALMGFLARERRSAASREVLTATDAGRTLYRTLGWRDYCPWATAMIPPPA